MSKDSVLYIQLSGAEIHDSKIVLEMIESLNDNLNIKNIVCDKAYYTDRIMSCLKEKNINSDIPSKNNRRIKYF